MPIKKLSAKGYYGGMAAATGLAVLLRSLSLALFADKTTGYFISGAPLPLITNIITALAALAAVLLPFLLLKESASAARHTVTVFTKCGAGLTALLFFLCFIAVCSKTASFPPFLAAVSFLLLLGAMVYFLLQMELFSTGATLRVVFGSMTIVALGCLVGLTYFDLTTPMNAPLKTQLHLSLPALMLYLLYELRALTGIGMPRMHTACSGLAFLLSLTVGLSNLIGFLSGVYTNSLYFAISLLLVTFAMYIGARAMTTANEAEEAAL